MAALVGAAALGAEGFGAAVAADGGLLAGGVVEVGVALFAGEVVLEEVAGEVVLEEVGEVLLVGDEEPEEVPDEVPALPELPLELEVPEGLVEALEVEGAVVVGAEAVDEVAAVEGLVAVLFKALVLAAALVAVTAAGDLAAAAVDAARAAANLLVAAAAAFCAAAPAAAAAASAFNAAEETAGTGPGAAV